jgi:hypothetical protein
LQLKLFIALIKDTTYMTSITINGNGGLISKRDFFQPTDGWTYVLDTHINNIHSIGIKLLKKLHANIN